jgi:hypothetical protein
MAEIEKKQSAVTAADSVKAHAKSDVDAAQYAQHHTLGTNHNQASAGDHVHDGYTSRKIGLVPTGGTVGQVLAKNSSTDWDTGWVTGGGGSGVGDPGANGLMVRTALNTTVAVALANGSTKVSITNPDGTTGNPTIDVVPANFTGIPESGVTNLVTDLAAKAPVARLINTTAPLTGGGDLSADRTHAIAANGITNALAAQMAANTIKGNNTGALANAADLTTTQIKAMLAIAESDVTNLVTDLAAKATDSLVVHLAGTESITGTKTFTVPPTLATATASIAAANIPSGVAKTTPAAGDLYATAAGLFFSAGAASNARRIPGKVFQRCTANTAAATTGTYVIPTGMAATPVISGRTYRFKLVLFYTVAAATYGLQSRLSYPTLTAGSFAVQTFTNATVVARAGSTAAMGVSPSVVTATAAAVTTQLEQWIEGFIIPSANGNFTYDFTPSASGTANALAGSFLELTEVA